MFIYDITLSLQLLALTFRIDRSTCIPLFLHILSDKFIKFKVKSQQSSRGILNNVRT